MTFYLVGGAGASTASVVSADHLPSNRARLYPSDTSDAEWQVIAPLIPAGQPSRRGGRRPVHSRRDIVDAIRYLAHNGCVWRALPADFPPWQTVYDYHARWSTDGTVNRLHNTLRDQVRTAAGREPEPSAAIIDSQSVRAAETVARASRGYDAGKRVNGRKRHIAVDTIGLLLVVAVSAASVQDRQAGRVLLWAVHTVCRKVTMTWADSGYSGTLVDFAAALGVTVTIVAKLAGQFGFHVLPRRWVVERTLSWISRCRRTVRDYERLPEHHAAIVQWSMIIIMSRRLARHHRP
ncbi:IS5 family transposase [Couchioplanes caeruleus]|uniref:Putative transposase n=1 Tax=Couchioplanes caeruleus TaxID=56438 RepID=A0A3N1GM67_9ACTN|nr:IS5 family transposase [Couchioplanes caeruleus]ROP31364.1 putative transposase [Couchioplanes caeruleus]